MTTVTVTDNGMGFILRRYLNVLTHVLIGIICYEMMHRYWPFRHTSSEFVIHAYLCTIGIILLMGEGFLAFSPDNVLTDMFLRHVNRKIHIVLLSLGTILTVTGVIFQIVAKSKINHASHFQSSHAITGLISTLLLIITCFSGIFMVFSKQLIPSVRPVILKLGHYLIAIIAFVVGIVSYTLIYGSDDIGYTICVCLIALVCLLKPLKTVFNKFQDIFSS